MRLESRTIQTLIGLRRAEDLKKIARIRAEIEVIHLQLKAQREEKYSPNQPRDWHGRWTGGGGNARQPADESFASGRDSFGTAPDGTPIEAAGTSGFTPNEEKMTVQSFRSAYCLGSIREVLPGEFNLMTIAEVIAQANKGDANARRCLKLLGEPRFRK